MTIKGREKCNMKLILRNLLLGALLLVFVVGTGWAQVGGRLTGTVKDESNAVIGGASIVVRNTATAIKQSTTTDSQGAYSFPVLAVGQYEVEINAPGFTT